MRVSIFAALLAELRAEYTRPPEAWLLGALRLLSWGLIFPRAACLLARFDLMLEHVREHNTSLFRDIFKEQYTNMLLRTVHGRLAGRPRGPYRNLRILHEWVGGTVFIYFRYIALDLLLSAFHCDAHAW